MNNCIKLNPLNHADFFGWIEDTQKKALAERAGRNEGWVHYWITRPWLNLPAEPSPVPFHKSLLHSAIINAIVNRPVFVEQTFDISESLNSKFDERILFKMWELYNARSENNRDYLQRPYRS